MAPPNFMMPKAEYMALLERLVVALMRKHGELSVRAVHEMANQLIVTHGITDARKHV